MTVINEIIERKGYDLIDALHDESDALDSFVNDYNGSTYICDAISQVADSFTPIYHKDIWANVAEIQEYIEEAMANGLAPVDGRNIDLIKIFQAGYYQYYTESLYSNLDAMAYNYIANIIDSELQGFSADTVDLLDIGEIQESIELEVENFDNNNRFDNLDDIAKDILNRIKNSEYTQA